MDDDWGIYHIVMETPIEHDIIYWKHDVLYLMLGF